MNWNSVTAVFGGTFDPPHWGHAEAIQGLFKNPGVAKVRIMPAFRSPFKTSTALTSPDARLGLTQALQSSLPISFQPDVLVDTTEILKNQTSYTYDTIQTLRQSGISPLAWVIGTDQLVALHKWAHFPGLLKLCHWIVLNRSFEAHHADTDVLPQNTLKQFKEWGLLEKAPDSDNGNLFKIKGSAHCLALVSTPARALSSTHIREHIALHGNPPEGSLPPAVEGYLKNHRLYGI